jgi:hypothetical protein
MAASPLPLPCDPRLCKASFGIIKAENPDFSAKAAAFPASWLRHLEMW